MSTENIAATLRTINPNEPGGDWSVYDIARSLYGDTPTQEQYEADRKRRESRR